MDAAEFAEYGSLCRIIRSELMIASNLPDVRQGAAALVGAAAEQAARVFYHVVGIAYDTYPVGTLHGGAEGECAACRGRCDIPACAANAERFRAMIPRLEELSRASEVR